MPLDDLKIEKNDALVRKMTTEISATAASAESAALIQSRFVMALKRPRNMEQVRLDILKECKRPNFVRETEEGKGNSALYRRPVGGGKSAEGLGIRFVEMALQCMGNNLVDSFTVQESDTERVLHVFALDIEKNNSWGKTITLSKTVERKYLKDGEQPIRMRMNSQNQTIYVLPSDEGSFATKESAEISKSSRTLGLRLIPGDIQDQAIKTIKETRYSEVQEDPDAAMRRVIDGMAKQNVSVLMLEAYLDHPVAQITPAQIVNLQGLYASLRDGDTTWVEIMRDAEEDKKNHPKPKPSKGVEAAKEKIRQEQQTTAPPPVETKAVKPACESCGISDVELVVVEGVKLCPNCKPKPVVEAPKTEEKTPAPVAQSTPAAPPTGAGVVTEGPKPWEKPKTTTSTPVTAAPPAWARPKATQAPALATTVEPKSEPKAGTLSLEDQVAEMAIEKNSKPRMKPKNPAIKKVKLPEFADRASDADAWTPEQYQRMITAFSNVPGIFSEYTDEMANQGHTREEFIAKKLDNTITDYIGLHIEQINSATLETFIGIVENFTDKEALKVWAVSKGLWIGE